MAFESPVSVLYNGEGLELALSASQSLSNASQGGLMIMGSGSNGTAQFFRLGGDGSLFITGSVTTNVATVATQSVFVGGWANGVTGSFVLGGIATAVTQSTREIGASTATVSATIAANGLVGFTLLAASNTRKGAVLFLEGNRIAFVKLGTGADTNTFTTRLTNGAYWEIPGNYTGPVTVSFQSGAAVARLYTTNITV